jgi:hypothetical protein
MKHIYALVFALVVLSVLITSKLMAAELLWEMPVAGPVTVEMGPSPTGPFTTVATVPQGTTRFLLTPGQWGHYRVRNTAGPSNTAQYAMDVYSDTVTNRLGVLEGRVAALEQPVAPPPPPATSSNITSRQVDQDRIEITGTNCVSLRTSGTGLRRVVECVH